MLPQLGFRKFSITRHRLEVLDGSVSNVWAWLVQCLAVEDVGNPGIGVAAFGLALGRR